MDAFAARATDNTIPIDVVDVRGYKAWLQRQSAGTKAWLKAQGVQAKPGLVVTLPGRGGIGHVLLVRDDGADMWSFGALPAELPPGRYRIRTKLPAQQATRAAVAFGLGRYVFARYRKAPRRAKLVWPDEADRASVRAQVEAITLGRDLINTPAGDLAPRELCAAAEALAARFDGACEVTVGDDLLDAGYPTVHAVGRASASPPCLADLTWGDEDAPRLTLVGKGVVFDSGGLDLKSASGMKLMKKDMGGAASVLALAHMIMASGLPVRLRVLIPAVENAVSGAAYRPGDVLRTRAGTTVEVGNTDAEGRLILCDALAAAGEERPDVLVDFATLTGASRIALGTELPGMFATDDTLADAVLAAGIEASDPLWRMPLHEPYRRLLKSDIADLNNVASSVYGGSITAALFLREFLPKRTRWLHVDTMAWNSSKRPGRPKGGEIMGARAMFAALAARYGHA